MKIRRSLSLTTIGALLLMVAFLIHGNANMEPAAASGPLREASELSISLPEEQRGQAPDLVIESFTLKPTTPQINEPVVATIRVRNRGDANASGGFRAYLYIDPADQPPTADTNETQEWGYFITLPPGGTTEFEAAGHTFTQPGCNHKIYAWVDRDNRLEEGDENNNVSELQICVSPPADTGDQDIYEPNNTCAEAKEIPTNGTAETHYFRPEGDVDFVKFQANAGEKYLVQAVGTGEDAWPELALFDEASCVESGGSFGGTSRLEFTAPETTTYYLRLINNLDTYNPDKSDYRLTVQGENTQQEEGVAPTLSTILPNSGINDRNTNVIIEGTDFHVTPLVELCPYENGSCQEGTVEQPRCKQLLDTSWVTSQKLLAIVPANLEIGPHCLLATNPAGGTGQLENAFTVRPGTPDLREVRPNESYNDVPNDINVYGFNFAEGISVRLNDPDNTSLSNVTVVNSTHLRGTVPAGLTAGSYDLEAFNEPGEVATLSDAYTILEAAQSDDLFGQADELWVDPVAPRAGAATKLGLVVHRQGGDSTLSDVLVRFSVDGQTIGDATVTLLGPDSEQNSTQIEWTPSAQGDYEIKAEIDPDGQFSESSESNNTIVKTVTVLEQAPDSLAPRVDSLLINDGSESVEEREVKLKASATDFGSPSGSVADIRYIELEYAQGSRVWVPVADSGWQDYATSNNDYAWTLSPVGGIHYIQAWARDQDGNISTFPNQPSVNYLPPTGRVSRNQARVHRQQLTAGQTLNVTLKRISGDPDLYIWPPNWEEGNPPWVSNQEGNLDEILSIQAPVSGTYQVEVYGFSAAEYQLTIETSRSALQSSRLALQSSPSGCGDRGCPTQPAIPLNSEPPINDPTPTSTPTPDPTDFSLYLPAIIR
ncbi:MAG: CARDB domain-containing protein [Ardenticatenaceae bacterium]